ncbi:RDD family protein [Isoptericola sp. NPDC055881]
MTSPAPVAPPPAPPNPPLTIEHALGLFSDERPRAAWGLRLLAVLLDSAVVGSVVFLATGDDTGLAALPGLGDSGGPSDDAATAAWAAGTLLLLGVLQAYTGMTPGKRVAGISVVDDRSGRPIGLPGTALRWFARARRDPPDRLHPCRLPPRGPHVRRLAARYRRRPHHGSPAAPARGSPAGRP